MVNKYSDALNVCAKALRIVEMSKRWGSRTHSGTISLAWRLVYAPKRVAAYVVAHELAHLRISNHSQKFWNLLGAAYGNHKQEHEWNNNRFSNETDSWFSGNDNTIVGSEPSIKFGDFNGDGKGTYLLLQAPI